MISAADIEHWRAVPDYEGLYEVSDRGNVRSLDRTVFYTDGRVRLHKGRLISPGHDPNSGYLSVNLWRTNRVTQIKVQRLVSLAFNGEGPQGAWAAHANFVRDDNSAPNISWLTPRQNRARMFAAGRGRKKIDRATADRIRDRFKAGERQCDLAQEHKLSRGHISSICRGRSWRD